MRHRLVLGLSLAGVVTGSAVAQFAGDRVPTTPGQLPTAPMAPPTGAYVPPVGGFQPATTTLPPGYGNVRPATGFQPATGAPQTLPPVNVEIPRALPLDHPWALRPETGPWFICVKSYSRPARPDPADPGFPAKDLAEALAAEIRNTYQVGAYLFEYISEEKRAEAEARARAIQQSRAFRDSLVQTAHASQLRGMQFLEPDNKIYYKTFRYRDQVAVLVGPFQTEADAVKALGKMKAWPPPKDTRLMDGGAIVKPGSNGQSVIERTHINPYTQAMVVANPSIPRAGMAEGQMVELDPLIRKLNAGRPYSLMNATKGWTLAVKSFTAPVVFQTKDDENTSMMRRFGASKGADVLNAGAEQAEQLAKALRDPRMKPHPFEAFVMHTRTGSIVTVGQFDSPTDPELLETQRILMGMKLAVSKDANGQLPAGEKPEMFPNVIPVPIPK